MESPRFRREFGGIIDADAGCASNLPRREPLRRPDRQRRIGEVGAIEAAVDGEGAAQVAGAARQKMRPNRLPNRATLAHAWQQADDQAVMHPVGEVDVGMPRRPIHDLVTRRAPSAGRMASEVAGPAVGLDLDDDSCGRRSVGGAVHQ